jgi:TolA-binding protein
MEAELSSSTSAQAEGPESNRPQLSQLWQAHLFVVGLVSFLFVYFLPPDGSDSLEVLARRNLDEAAQALEVGDCERTRALAEQVLEAGELPPVLAGDARFLLGSVNLARAAELQGNERVETARHALILLRQAEQRGVSPANQSRLSFRLAKADFFTGTNPERVIKVLEKALSTAPTDRAEGYALLAVLHLQKPAPDLEAVLRANEKLLAQPELTDPNPARLQRGELLLRLHQASGGRPTNRTAEARQVLARIPPEAPEFAAARHLRALSFFYEGDLKAAANLWEEALADGQRQLGNSGLALYHLGSCLVRLEKPDDACRVWERLTSDQPGSSEAVAATLQLAELNHRLGRDEEALGHYAAVLPSLDANSNNPYLDVQTARQIVEAGWSRWFTARQWDQARRLAKLYQSLALPGEADQRFALASQETGLALLQQLDKAPTKEADTLRQQARHSFLEAGEAFEAVARQREDKNDYGNWLWASAENYLRGQHYARAANVLDRYLNLEIPEKRRLQALLGRGEVHQALKQNAQAEALLQQALRQPGPLAARARYLLALAQIDQGKLPEAEHSLQEILRMPVLEVEPDDLRHSQFALGHVLYRRGQYAAATSELEQAIEKYPRDPQVSAARYWLAESYRQAARQEHKNVSKEDAASAREFYSKQRRRSLDAAHKHFQLLTYDLSDREERGLLTKEEVVLLRESRFGLGECRYHLGKYEEAITTYEELAHRYQHQVEGLTALMHLAHAYWTLKRMDQAEKTLQRAREALVNLDDKELQRPQLTRQEYKQWIDWAAANCRPSR